LEAEKLRPVRVHGSCHGGLIRQSRTAAVMYSEFLSKNAFAESGSEPAVPQLSQVQR